MLTKFSESHSFHLSSFTMMYSNVHNNFRQIKFWWKIKKPLKTRASKAFAFLLGYSRLSRFCVRDEFAASGGVTQFAQGFFFDLAHALTREAIFVGYGLKCPTGAVEAEIETDDVGFAIIQGRADR